MLSSQTLSIGTPVPTISVIDGIPTTTSINVARDFEKRHDAVLRDIRNIVSELPQNHSHNFVEMLNEVRVGNGATRKDPAYRLTRDGFTLLAMGFTGKKALTFKLAYIEAFNRMERDIAAQKPTFDVETLCGFIVGGVIDSQAVLRIGSAAGMMMYRHANVTEKGWGDAVAAQIDETLPARDLNVILQAAALETWHRARGASKPPAKTVPLRSDFQLAK